MVGYHADLLGPDLLHGFLESVGRFFERLGITPNQLTITGLFLQAVVAAVIAAGYLPLAGVLLILFSIFDAFDGTLARLTGQSAASGRSWTQPWIAMLRRSCCWGSLCTSPGVWHAHRGVADLHLDCWILACELHACQGREAGYRCTEGILTWADAWPCWRSACCWVTTNYRSCQTRDNRAVAAGHPEQCYRHPADFGWLEATQDDAKMNPALG